MRKCMFLVVLLALMTVGVSTPAFSADGVQLQVNGDTAPSPDVFLDNDRTMISAVTYARLSGADFSEAGDVFTITENGKTLTLTNGKEEAMIGKQTIALHRAAIKTNNVVYIPLRSVSNVFGFEVGWDAEKWLVSLDREETRDGMTAFDLLSKSNAASLKHNTYSMDGSFDMNMEIMSGGKLVEDAPTNLDMSLTGQIQNKPMKIYMVVKINADEAGLIPEMAIEIYMDEEKMHMKMPGQEWLTMDQTLPPEFWKQQEAIQSDPLKAVTYMKEMGIMVNYGNDIKLDGKDYYAVNASLDFNKFMENFPEMFQQAMQTAPSEAQENPADMQQELQKLIENASLEYFYTLLINKETLMMDTVNFYCKIDMTMENPEPAADQTGEQQPKDMNIKYDINGTFNIGGLGEPFKAPVINDSVKTPVN